MMFSMFLNYRHASGHGLDGLAIEDVFTPGPDESGEFEVEDILDMRVSRNGSRSFRVLWRGYSVFESTCGSLRLI